MKNPRNRLAGGSASIAIVLIAVACRDLPDLRSPLAGALDPLKRSGQSPLVAAVSVDDDDGDLPHRVVFDASGSELGAEDVTYEWSFGDGAVTRDGPVTVHTYVGVGEYTATLTLTDASGRSSSAQVTIEVDPSDCPDEVPPATMGDVEDDDLDEISGIAASRLDPEAYWVHKDKDIDGFAAVDLWGRILSEHDLPTELVDVEDIATALDPATGTSMLFLADIGDNDEERPYVSLWILEEPDPHDDGDVDPIEVKLTFPGGPTDAETLLVDPFTLDAYLLSKGGDDGSELFVKRAPHVEGGPYLLQSLGTFESLDFTATGGDVSLDGLRVVVRGYGRTAHVWSRDGHRPLEEVFEQDDPCEVELPADDQYEAVTFSIDGRGLVTTNEGEEMPIWFVGL